MQCSLIPLLITAVLAIPVTVAAGDLDPPPGPVAPSMRTIQETFDKAQEGVDKAIDAETAALAAQAAAVAAEAAAIAAQDPRTPVNATNTPGDADSLFRITQPGSYYLTAHITGEPGKSGIEIDSSNVTLDLNGFTVQGVSGALHGIDCSGQQNVVRNGTVMSWPSWGISAGGPFCRIDDVIVNANNGGGIGAGGYALVTGCIATNSADLSGTGHGISTGNYSVIRDCTTTSNMGCGLRVGHVSVVSNVVAYGNHSTGASGIDCGNNSVIMACAVKDNYEGIEAGTGSTIQNTAISDNEKGILGDVAITVHSCTIEGTDNCAVEAYDSLIRGNTFRNPNGTDICGTGNTTIENHLSS